MTRDILVILSDEETGQYQVNIGQGSNIPETAFAVSVLMKCLIKDGKIKDKYEYLDLINKYMDDPQYGEVQDVDEVEGEEDETKSIQSNSEPTV